MGRRARDEAGPRRRGPAEQPAPAFTLDGAHIDFVQGFRLPCHFDERKGTVVIPDLHGRVTLIDKRNQVMEHLGDSNAPEWNNPLRTHRAPVHAG